MVPQSAPSQSHGIPFDRVHKSETTQAMKVPGMKILGTTARVLYIPPAYYHLQYHLVTHRLQLSVTYELFSLHEVGDTSSVMPPVFVDLLQGRCVTRCRGWQPWDCFTDRSYETCLALSFGKGTVMVLLWYIIPCHHAISKPSLPAISKLQCQ